MTRLARTGTDLFVLFPNKDATTEVEGGQESSEEVGVDVGGSGESSKKCDEKGGQKVGSWAAEGACHAWQFILNRSCLSHTKDRN